MGWYINIDSKGNRLPRIGKAEALIADGAEKISTPSMWEEDLVCVVENFAFDAAAYCYSEQELLAFTISNSDTRPRTWLKYKHARNLAE